VHHIIDGHSSQQQQELTAKIHKLLETKTTSLLKRHKHFMDVDFMKLGSGTTIKCQVWVANVEMVISVAKVVHGNFCTQETLRVLHTPQLKPSSNLPYRQTPNCPPHQTNRAYNIKAIRSHNTRKLSLLCTLI
jgi:hypothetical protein